MTVRVRGACRAAMGLSVVFGLALAFFAHPASGQAYRAWVGSSVQMAQLRPVGLDTIPVSQVVAASDGTLLHDGYPVQCSPSDVCTGYLPLSVERTFVATQDAGVTFWGTGVSGLSATALVRIRTDLGGGVAWPRSDDEFDAMLAYAQYVRGTWRARAGRQDVRSGLGISRFDGVSTSHERGALRFEAYGGRSLARGLREPSNEAARALDDFFVDQGVRLFGGAATVRTQRVTLTGRYHRELLADRSGLDGERAALDVTAVVPRVRLTGSVDYDFSFQQIGKAHLTAMTPLGDGRWIVELTGRRYVPYFELSTIWGFFEPVSYTEGLARVAWSPSSTLGVWSSGGLRSYADSEAPVVIQPLEDQSWWADTGARWALGDQWSVDARYRIEWGVGAFLSSGDVSVRRAVSSRLTAGVSAGAFQQIEEYRLGEGRAYSLAGHADWMMTDRLDVTGSFAITRHRDGGTVFTSPWNQTRAWTSVRWRVGSDPGLANRGSRP